MVMNLKQSIMPEILTLGKRFDFAMMKKVGVVKRPPTFWVKDPKINLRSGHIYWAALLLLDFGRIEKARAVIAVESAAGCQPVGERLEETIVEITSQLLACISDSGKRRKLSRQIRKIVA